MDASRIYGYSLVMDIGSGTVRAGDSGSEKPFVVYPTLLGSPKYPKIGLTIDMQMGQDNKIGDYAQEKRGILALRYPVQHGVVTNWDDMELIWNDIFYSWLRKPPDEQPITYPEAVLNPKVNREILFQLMFEKLGTIGLFVCCQPVMAMVAANQTSGLICDSGEGVTQIVPVYEGMVMCQAIQRVDFAGGDVTFQLGKSLRNRSYSLTTAAEFEIAREIKEKFAAVSLGVEPRYNKINTTPPTESTYQLPDGSIIKLEQEALESPEMMFNPSLTDTGYKVPGIAELIHSSIMKCDETIREALYGNILLAGGNTLCTGFPERLEKEIRSLAPNPSKVKVTAPLDRRYTTWKGAARFSHSASFKEKFLITRSQYDECGASIIHRKCF